MLNKFKKGLVILGLLFPLVTQAQQCKSAHGVIPCDVAFTVIPAFSNMCLGAIQSGTYSIRNNSPVTLRLNYIRIRNNDALPAAATQIVASPANNCGAFLGAGATCNITLNLQPLTLGFFNRVLQIGINSRQVELDAPAISTVVNCVTPIPPGVPPVPVPSPGLPIPPEALPISQFQVSILGASTVTSTGLTVVNGDVDVSPGSAITGFPPGTVVNGSLHAADAVAATAHAIAQAYYNNLVSLPCPPANNLTGQDLGGKILTPGVYCFNSSAFLTGALTLVGGPASAFVFQIGSTLVTSANSSVVLAGGVSSGNVSWAVGSSATIGTGTAFTGIIDAVASITLNTGASLRGRAWALNGAVTLDNNAVNPN